MGNDLKKVINQRYSHVEIDIDGIFKMILLLAKKKYAALTIGSNINDLKKETKGLDLVRRDWCDLSKEMGQCVFLGSDMIRVSRLTSFAYGPSSDVCWMKSCLVSQDKRWCLAFTAILLRWATRSSPASTFFCLTKHLMVG